MSKSEAIRFNPYTGKSSPQAEGWLAVVATVATVIIVMISLQLGSEIFYRRTMLDKLEHFTSISEAEDIATRVFRSTDSSSFLILDETEEKQVEVGRTNANLLLMTLKAVVVNRWRQAEISYGKFLVANKIENDAIMRFIKERAAGEERALEIEDRTEQIFREFGRLDVQHKLVVDGIGDLFSLNLISATPKASDCFYKLECENVWGDYQEGVLAGLPIVEGLSDGIPDTARLQEIVVDRGGRIVIKAANVLEYFNELVSQIRAQKADLNRATKPLIAEFLNLKEEQRNIKTARENRMIAKELAYMFSSQLKNGDPARLMFAAGAKGPRKNNIYK